MILASPGMMQSGLSRQLFEAWCTDKRNGLIVAGYCVEGTLAKVKSEKGREAKEGGTTCMRCNINCMLHLWYYGISVFCCSTFCLNHQK